jgi:hypothetical protein
MIEEDITGLFFEYELLEREKEITLKLYHKNGDFLEYWGDWNMNEFYPDRKVRDIKEMDVAALLTFHGSEYISKGIDTRFLRLNVRRRGDRPYHCIELEL